MYNAKKRAPWSSTLVVQESLIALDIEVSLCLQLNQSNLYSQQAQIHSAALTLYRCSVQRFAQVLNVNHKANRGVKHILYLCKCLFFFYIVSVPGFILRVQFSQKHFVFTQQTDMGHVSFIDLALNSSQRYSSTGIQQPRDLSAPSAGISTIILLRQVVIDATLDPYPEQNIWGVGAHRCGL